jgi:hypothetical protein
MKFLQEMEVIGALVNPLECSPEDKIITQGGEDKLLYFTVKGNLTVTIKDFNNQTVPAKS